ncbi:NADP-dependent oxidoreductase domain-containing protein [Cyathus striatus]|nr:NADP-dependent oxidoreductase domain-containing protein [Cyathus striatus]
MSLFAAPAQPPSKLGRYRLLSPNAGVHVSPLQLGGVSVGDQWDDIGMGTNSKEDSFKLLDAFFDNGGNFIDTPIFSAQDGTSETFIGEWAEKRGIRDQLFIATKYSLNYTTRNPSIQQKILYSGTNAKALNVSLNQSLKNLRTTYIDLLYVHFWDFDTSVEEVMRLCIPLFFKEKFFILESLMHPLGSLLKLTSMLVTTFTRSQLPRRMECVGPSFERDIIPMARDQGMALAPWNILAGGKLRSDAEEEMRRQTGENGRTYVSPSWERNDTEKAMSRALEKVAKEVGANHITSGNCHCVFDAKDNLRFPIVGGRRVEQLLANVEALDISLTVDQVEYLESIVDFDPGFPHAMIGNGLEYPDLITTSGYIDRVSAPQPIKPVAN